MYLWVNLNYMEGKERERIFLHTLYYIWEQIKKKENLSENLKLVHKTILDFDAIFLLTIIFWCFLLLQNNLLFSWAKYENSHIFVMTECIFAEIWKIIHLRRSWSWIWKYKINKTCNLENLSSHGSFSNFLLPLGNPKIILVH